MQEIEIFDFYNLDIQDSQEEVTSINPSTIEAGISGRRLKQNTTSKQAVFDSNFQLPVSYMASGGIGMRWSKHYFENPLDMDFIDGQPHLEESKQRRLENIRQLTSADVLKDEEADIDQFSNLKAQTTPPIYLSHIYYTQRWDSFDSSTHGLATAQNGFLPQKDSDTCTQPPEITEEVDLAKEVIRSNRIRMGLAQFGNKDEQTTLRSSQLMSLAFNWLASTELPVDKIEQNENEQLIESFFLKMAKSHQIENFKHYQTLQSRYKNNLQKHDYWTSFYTVDQPMHLVSKLGGILEGIQAIDITELQKSKSPEAFSFFREKVMIQPNNINFNQISVLQPEQKKFVITNVQKQGEIQIENIVTSSPEVLIYLPKNQYYPVTLGPGESVSITVVIAPETWGKTETAAIISFSNLLNFMMPITSFHIENEYELEPIYFTNVNLGEQIQGQIKIKNPSTTDELEILEVYSTEEFLKLYWPNSVQLASSVEAQSNRDFSKYLKIEPGAKSKILLNYRFQTDQLVDHRAVIHLVTNRGVVLRIPLYFHLYTDLLKFQPSIVDFGILPFKFDAVRIPVQVTIRSGFEIGMLYLEEVLLPISEKRLDFVMGKWDRDSYGNIQVYNKQSMRLEEHRRGVLHKDRQLDLFTIVLNPIAYGEINTQIILVFTNEEGKVFRIELPIIGHVLKQSSLLVENDEINTFEPWKIAKPAFTLNVKSYLSDDSKLLQGQLFKNKKVEQRLIIQNNLGTKIQNIEVVNTLPEVVFVYQSGKYFKSVGSQKFKSLGSSQKMELGSFYINLKDLKTTSGRFYFFLVVNQNVFVPMSVQISDQNLVCSWMPIEMQPQRYADCASGIFLDYKNIALNQPKYKYINITNIGSESVQLDWIQSTGDNELFVTFKSLHPPHIPGAPEFQLGRHRGASIDFVQKKLGFSLQPQQTVILEIGVEGYVQTLNFSSQRKLTIQFSPQTYGQLKIDVTYNTQSGTASFLPKKQKITFAPTYVGASSLQTQTITFSSTLPKPVHIKQLTLDNPQFKVITMNSKLKNGAEVFKIQFDPNEKQLVQGVAIAIKNTSDNSLILQRVTNQENPPLGRELKSQNQIGKLTPISILDITKYRNLQEQLFIKKKKSDSKIVTATLTIETDQLSVSQYKLEGEIIQPQIIAQTSIDFGKVPIGSSSAHNLVINNPYGEPLQIQIYVGRSTSEIESELRRLKLVASSNNRIISEQTGVYSQTFENILRTLNYTRFHCNKLKGPENQENTMSDFLNSNDADRNKDWLYYEEDPIQLSRESTKDQICSQLTLLLSQYDSFEQFQNDLWLWSQIEEYFRQIILISANFDSNMSFDSFTKDQLKNLGLQQQLELIIEQLVFSVESSLIEENAKQIVDQQILSDLNWCSLQQPYLEINQTQWLHITTKVSFPNPIDHYFPIRPQIKKLINGLISPLRWVQNIFLQSQLQETWLDVCQMIFNDFYFGFYDLVEMISSSRKRSVNLRPEDFLASRLKDKNFMPAATTTNSIQFQNINLHKELIKNNGTLGVERNVQSFFLNQKYNKMITIPPNQDLTLPQAIIYEPHALLNSDVKHQMVVYIKTDHLHVQTLTVTGSTSSPVLELTQILRQTSSINLDNNFQHIMTNVAMTPHLCRQQNERNQQMGQFGNAPPCKNQHEISEQVNQQIFGKSTITSLIQLRVDTKDALGENEQEEMLGITQNNFIQRIKIFLSQTSRHLLQLEPIIEMPILPEQYIWMLSFTNIGNNDFLSTKFGFEDPITGEISCNSGDLRVEPCDNLDVIQAQSFQQISIVLNSDYSTSSYKKTLVFQSSSFIQRFPIVIITDQRLLDFVSQFGRQKNWRFEFTLSLIMGGLTIILMTHKQYLRLKQIHQTDKFQENQKLSEESSSSKEKIRTELQMPQNIVMVHYQQVQDRFRMHNNQFMREVTNLGKRSNSAFTEYQKTHQLFKKPQTQIIPSANISAGTGKHKIIQQRQFQQNLSSPQKEIEEYDKAEQSSSQQDFELNQNNILQEDLPEFNQPKIEVVSIAEQRKTQNDQFVSQQPTQISENRAPTGAVNHYNKDQGVTVRMNKKERRAYEMRKKELEVSQIVKSQQQNEQFQSNNTVFGSEISPKETQQEFQEVNEQAQNLQELKVNFEEMLQTKDKSIAEPNLNKNQSQQQVEDNKTFELSQNSQDSVQSLHNDDHNKSLDNVEQQKNEKPIFSEQQVEDESEEESDQESEQERQDDLQQVNKLTEQADTSSQHSLNSNANSSQQIKERVFEEINNERISQTNKNHKTTQQQMIASQNKLNRNGSSLNQVENQNQKSAPPPQSNQTHSSNSNQNQTSVRQSLPPFSTKDNQTPQRVVTDVNVRNNTQNEYFSKRQPQPPTQDYFKQPLIGSSSDFSPSSIQINQQQKKTNYGYTQPQFQNQRLRQHQKTTPSRFAESQSDFQKNQWQQSQYSPYEKQQKLHAYHRNKHSDYQREDFNDIDYEQEDDQIDEDEYDVDFDDQRRNEDYNDQIQYDPRFDDQYQSSDSAYQTAPALNQQYQSYQKRPYWQQQLESTSSVNKVNRPMGQSHLQQYNEYRQKDSYYNQDSGNFNTQYRNKNEFNSNLRDKQGQSTIQSQTGVVRSTPHQQTVRPSGSGQLQYQPSQSSSQFNNKSQTFQQKNFSSGYQTQQNIWKPKDQKSLLNYQKVNKPSSNSGDVQTQPHESQARQEHDSDSYAQKGYLKNQKETSENNLSRLNDMYQQNVVRQIDEVNQSDRAQQDQQIQSQSMSNIYNAFKSIKSLFNPNDKVKVEKQDSQSRNPSINRDQNQQERPSFNSLFYGNENSIFSAPQQKKQQDQDKNQPKFSLFGDPIWGSSTVSENIPKYDSKPDVSMFSRFDKPQISHETQSQMLLYGDLGSSQQISGGLNFQKNAEKRSTLFSQPNIQPEMRQQELFKPVDRSYMQQETALQFKPLRSYNTMFTENLDSLTNKNISKIKPIDQTDQIQRPIHLLPSNQKIDKKLFNNQNQSQNETERQQFSYF